MLVRLHNPNVVPTGAVRLENTVKYLPILIVILCLYCYKVSVEKGEVRPFPNCTITGTATGYPQDIPWRTIMTPAMMFFILMMRTIYLMITGLSARVGRNANVPCEIWYFGLIGSLLYGIAMATIENGKMNNALHGGSAVIFFILFIIDLPLINGQLTELRAIDQSVISAKSLQAKKVIAKIIIWTVIIELIHLLIGVTFGVSLWHERVEPLGTPQSNKDSIIYGTDAEICIIEWVAVYGFAVYFYTFSWDWKNYAYILQFGQAAPKRTGDASYDVIAHFGGSLVVAAAPIAQGAPIVQGAPIAQVVQGAPITYVQLRN